jgi:Flp pilus assembly protein TadG
MVRRPQFARRSGAAAVECALVLNLVLFPILVGVWEIGRLIQIHELVAHSAREAARLAAQAVTIDSDGNQTRIRTVIDPPPAVPPTGWTYGNPNLKAAAFQALHGGGWTGWPGTTSS